MKKGVLVFLVVLIVAVLAAKFVFLDTNRDMVSPPRIERPASAPEEEPGPAADSGPRYPVAEIRVDIETREMPAVEKELPIPKLDDSDAALREAVDELNTAGRLDDLFVFESFIRHFVVTVDNLTREKLPEKYRLAEDVAGKFLVKKTDAGERFLLDPENYERYTPFVDLAEALDLRALVAVYTRFYPLFQQAYEELGYPDRYFNDRLIEVIDHLVAAPRVEGPVELVRPKVFYRFADPELESLSAGRKILIRMGPVNAERVKARLRDLRRLLAHG